MSLGAYVILGSAIGFLLGTFVGGWLFGPVYSRRLVLPAQMRRHKKILSRRLNNVNMRRCFRKISYAKEIELYRNHNHIGSKFY